MSPLVRRFLTGAALVLVVAVGAAGCSGGDDGAETAATTPAGTTAGGPDDTAPVTTVTTSVATTVATTAAPTTTAPTTTTTVVTSPLAELGVAPIEWTGPTEQAGERPTLSWSPVDGALEYRLVVADAATGRPVWAWQGSENSVPLGAGLIDGQEGPRLAGPVVVDVFALALDGSIMAASGPQPVSP